MTRETQGMAVDVLASLIIPLRDCLNITSSVEHTDHLDAAPGRQVKDHITANHKTAEMFAQFCPGSAHSWIFGQNAERIVDSCREDVSIFWTVPVGTAASAVQRAQRADSRYCRNVSPLNTPCCLAINSFTPCLA